MSEDTFNLDDFNCKVDVLFGNMGEHHLMIAGPSQTGIASYVHAMTHSEELAQSLLRELFDTVPDSEVREHLRNYSIAAAMQFMSGYPIKKFSTVTTGMVLTESDEKSESGGSKFEGEEVTVGMAFTFAEGNNSLSAIFGDIIRLFTEHRLFNALVSAYTGRDEEEINAVLVENEQR